MVLQDKIVKEMKVKEKIDPSYEIRTRVDFIKDKLISSNLKSLVLGISGGQDSTLCGKLCMLAIEELGDEYSFHSVRLPYGIQVDEEDCKLALEFIKPTKQHTVNIKQSVDTLIKDSVTNLSDFNKGNVKARIRMVVQYTVASNYNALVVGTDHSAEAITGFYTKFGDGAFDISPLFGLNKRQGKELLKYLNAPESLYLKVPTADLEEDKPALADEIALGITYDQIDDYLEGKVIDKEASDKLEAMYLKTQHKRHLPYTIYD